MLSDVDKTQTYLDCILTSPVTDQGQGIPVGKGVT